MTIQAAKTNIHFTDNSLIQPTNPITINLIGAGGTGSQVLTALARMNHALNELNHAGFKVHLWDDDIVTEANLGRQLFAESELKMYKSVTLINRVNRFFGTNWKAETSRFDAQNLEHHQEKSRAIITISCVDSVASRFEIATILEDISFSKYQHNQPKYWLDFGNSQSTGQVILATVGGLEQPTSKKYNTVANLPFVTKEFNTLLQQSEDADDTPSCSLAEALEKQDLFINSTLAQMGCSLLWNLLRNGLTDTRGFFLNLKTFCSQPIKL